MALIILLLRRCELTNIKSRLHSLLEVSRQVFFSSSTGTRLVDLPCLFHVVLFLIRKFLPIGDVLVGHSNCSPSATSDILSLGRARVLFVEIVGALGTTAAAPTPATAVPPTSPPRPDAGPPRHDGSHDDGPDQASHDDLHRPSDRAGGGPRQAVVVRILRRHKRELLVSPLGHLRCIDWLVHWIGVAGEVAWPPFIYRNKMGIIRMKLHVSK